MRSSWSSSALTDQSELTNRLLRFIYYNTERYIEHRKQGEYALAVRRLVRLRGLIQAAYQVGPMAPHDFVNVKLTEKHISAMLGDTSRTAENGDDDAYALG